MFPPIRNQSSILDDRWSADAAIDCSYLRGDPLRGHMARQEDRAEVDINTIVRNFGITGLAPQQKPLQWGVAPDDDLDLHTAYIMRADAQRAYMQMPKAVRDKYPSWHHMLDAIHTGDLKVRELESAPPVPAPSPAPEPTRTEAEP